MELKKFIAHAAYKVADAREKLEALSLEQVKFHTLPKAEEGKTDPIAKYAGDITRDVGDRFATQISVANCIAIWESIHSIAVWHETNSPDGRWEIECLSALVYFVKHEKNSTCPRTNWANTNKGLHAAEAMEFIINRLKYKQ